MDHQEDAKRHLKDLVARFNAEVAWRFMHIVRFMSLALRNAEQLLQPFPVGSDSWHVIHRKKQAAHTPLQAAQLQLEDEDAYTAAVGAHDLDALVASLKGDCIRAAKAAPAPAEPRAAAPWPFWCFNMSDCRPRSAPRRRKRRKA